MTEILLIVLLLVAIFCDIRRINDYLETRKSLRKISKELTIGKVALLYQQFLCDDESDSFHVYLTEHWDDPEELKYEDKRGN